MHPEVAVRTAPLAAGVQGAPCLWRRGSKPKQPMSGGGGGDGGGGGGSGGVVVVWWWWWLRF